MKKKQPLPAKAKLTKLIRHHDAMKAIEAYHKSKGKHKY